MSDPVAESGYKVIVVDRYPESAPTLADPSRSAGFSFVFIAMCAGVIYVFVAAVNRAVVSADVYERLVVVERVSFAVAFFGALIWFSLYFRPSVGEMMLVDAQPGSMAFVARRSYRRFAVVGWSLMTVYTAPFVLVAVLAGNLFFMRGSAFMALSTFVTLGFAVHAALGRSPLPALVIDPSGVFYRKGRRRSWIDWDDIRRVGVEGVRKQETEVAGLGQGFVIGRYDYESDPALVLQVLRFYADNPETRREIGVAALPRLRRGDFETVGWSRRR